MGGCRHGGRVAAVREYDTSEPIRGRIVYADGTHSAFTYSRLVNGAERAVARVEVDGEEYAPAAERDWWRREMLDAYDEAFPLYDRPECGGSTRPGVMVAAVLQGKDARIAGLEAGNRRLRASLESLRGNVAADMPAVALDWDNAPDERRREWCQHLYEHASAQDARVAELESLARDMHGVIRRYERGYDDFGKRMAELGIEAGKDES